MSSTTERGNDPFSYLPDKYNIAVIGPAKCGKKTLLEGLEFFQKAKKIVISESKTCKYKDASLYQCTNFKENEFILNNYLKELNVENILVVYDNLTPTNCPVNYVTVTQYVPTGVKDAEHLLVADVTSATIKKTLGIETTSSDAFVFIGKTQKTKYKCHVVGNQVQFDWKPKIEPLSNIDANSHKTICIIGKRDIGKTTVAKNIAAMCDADCGLILFRKENEYSEFIKLGYNVSKVDSGDDVENSLSRYLSIVSKDNKLRKGIIILDDIFVKNNKNYKLVFDLMLNNKHYKQTVIITAQFSYFPPEVRANFNYIMLGRDSYISDMKRYYEHYAGFYPLFNKFKEDFSKLEDEDYSFYVINNLCYNNTDEKFFYTRSDLSLIPTKKVEHLEINYEEKDDNFELDNFKKILKTELINIKESLEKIVASMG